MREYKFAMRFAELTQKTIFVAQLHPLLLVWQKTCSALHNKDRSIRNPHTQRHDQTPAQMCTISACSLSTGRSSYSYSTTLTIKFVQKPPDTFWLIQGPREPRPLNPESIYTPAPYARPHESKMCTFSTLAERRVQYAILLQQPSVVNNVFGDDRKSAVVMVTIVCCVFFFQQKTHVNYCSLYFGIHVSVDKNVN